MPPGVDRGSSDRETVHAILDEALVGHVVSGRLGAIVKGRRTFDIAGGWGGKQILVDLDVLPQKTSLHSALQTGQEVTRMSALASSRCSAAAGGQSGR